MKLFGPLRKTMLAGLALIGALWAASYLHFPKLVQAIPSPGGDQELRLLVEPSSHALHGRLFTWISGEGVDIHAELRQRTPGRILGTALLERGEDHEADALAARVLRGPAFVTVVSRRGASIKLPRSP